MYTEIMQTQSGFREVEHTADWALEIWAPTLEGLLSVGIEGIYSLTGTRLVDEVLDDVFEIQISSVDDETMLVEFLSEILFLSEERQLGVKKSEIMVRNKQLFAKLFLSTIVEQEKEIKAVTFHNLNIIRGESGLKATLVFDV